MAALGELFGVQHGLARPGRRLAGRATPPTSPSTSPAPTSASRSRAPFNDATREVFSGCPELKDGYFCANEAPGWGIEVDERAAAKYPFGHGERASASG